MKRYAKVLLLAALGACEGTYTENEGDGVEGRDEADRVGSRDQDATPDDEFGVRRTGTQPTGTQPSGTQPSGTQPSGTQPSGTQPSGTQPTGTQPSGMQPGGATPPPGGMTQPPSGAAGQPPAAGAQQASAQLVDTQTKAPIGTLQLQTRGEDVVVKADLAQAQAPSGQTFTVHVAQAATGCTGDASNLVKAAGPSLGTMQPGSDWKAIPAMDLEGPNSVVGKTIVIQPQAAAGQQAGAPTKVFCGVVSGSGGSAPSRGTPPSGGMTPSGGGMTPSGGSTPSGGTTPSGGSNPR